MIKEPIGFVGLGNMGRPMATNLTKAGHQLIVYDKAGTAERAPKGTVVASSVAEVAAKAETVFFSLPDATASTGVAQEIIESKPRSTRCVADTSTIGVQASRDIGKRLKAVGIDYIDAPVSGGVAGAVAGTISTMFAGRADTYERLLPMVKAMSKNPFHVGTEVRAVHSADVVGAVCADIWERFVRTAPGADFTEIYRFIRDQK